MSALPGLAVSVARGIARLLARRTRLACPDCGHDHATRHPGQSCLNCDCPAPLTGALGGPQ